MRFQTAPLGLLGALDLKAQGINPDEFSRELAPTIDTAAFYLAQGMQISQNATNHAAIIDGEKQVLTVPAGVCWWLWSVSGAVAFAAGDTLLDTWPLYVGFESPNTINVAVNIGPPGVKGVIAGAISLRAGGWVPRPILLPPGSSVIARCCGGATVLAARPMVVAALYTPVPV